MDKTYFFIFLTFCLSFTYLAFHFIETRFGFLDLVVFTLLVLLSMVCLIALGSELKSGPFLAILLFAFLLNYMIFLFLEVATITRFILALLNVVAFVVSVFRSIPAANSKLAHLV